MSFSFGFAGFGGAFTTAGGLGFGGLGVADPAVAESGGAEAGGAFAVLALMLSAVGLYSVVSYAVAQRTPEFGIRMALGAQQRDVMRNVMGSMVLSVGGGVAAGVALVLILSRVIANWVEGGAQDPLILIGVWLVLGAASAAACFIPAKRASAVDPMVALRYE